MNKMVITLVIASLYTGSVFAAGGAALEKSGAKAVQELQGKDIKAPGAASGSRITTEGVTKSATAERAGVDQKKAANDNGYLALVSDNHNSCPVDSAATKVLSKIEINTLMEAAGLRVTAGGCAPHFQEADVLHVVAAIEAAAVAKAHELNVSDVITANNEQLREIKKAMIGAIQTKLNLTPGAQGYQQAVSRFVKLCEGGCDVATQPLCDVNI